MKKVMACQLCLALLLCTLTVQASSFKDIRYNGGTLATKVDAKDWGNKLDVTSEEIILSLKDGQTLKIDPKSVTGLSYGQEAHRRVGTMIALAVLVAPLALFGLLHKTRLHFVGIEYNTEDGKKGGVLLQAHKDNYRGVLEALHGATGAPISVAAEDRKYVPAVVNTVVAEDPKKGKRDKRAEGSESKADDQAGVTGIVKVTSDPDGADVYVDGAFIGNAPAQLKLAPGKHTIKVTSAMYQEWSRDV